MNKNSKKKKIKILIVDYNKKFCNSIKPYLNEENDFKIVAIVFSELDAYNKIIKLRPDIVLIDKVMPDLNGIGILEKLVASNISNTQYIMITGSDNGDKEDIIRNNLNLITKNYKYGTFDNKLLVSYIKNPCKDTTEKIQSNICINSDIQWEIEITNILHNLGIPAHIKGYLYLRKALMLAIKDVNILDCITKTLYPAVAKQLDTTSIRVERSIRHAIEVGWSRGEAEFINNLFGYTINKKRGRPTNNEFIALISDKLRLQFKYNNHSIK